jgi:hypothetical protein
VTIHQLEKPCWILDPNLATEGEPHYPDEASAISALREAKEENPDLTIITRPLGDRCWVVQCDGDCEQVIDEEDEGYVFHHGSRAEAEETIRQWHFVYGAGDLVYCETDRPEGAEVPPPSPAELEAAGQLRLPGVAS